MDKQLIQSVIQTAIMKATALIGTKETSPNRGAIVDTIQKEFGMVGNSWCAMFVWYCYNEAHKQVIGKKVPLYKTASSQRMYEAYDINGFTYKDSKLMQPGDICIWQHNPNTATGHVGLITTYYDQKTGRFGTIEGNTSSGEVGSQSNGDGVFARSRNGSKEKFNPNVDFHIRGFINMTKVLNG